MMRSRLGYGVGLVLAVLLCAPSPAHAAEPPRIDRLTGRVLHTADGDTVTIPVPKRRQNSLELLGTVRGGWLVAHHWTGRMLIVSPEGRLVRRISYTQFEDYPGGADLMLSARGTRVLVLSGDRGDETDATMLDLRGHVVARHHFRSLATPLAAQGPTFHIALERRLVAWHIGARPVSVEVAGVQALDPSRQLLVREQDDVEGLTTVKHPDRFRWTFPQAVRYSPKTFAPNGRHVATTSGRHRVLVLAGRDGSTTTSLRFSAEVLHPAVWEDRSHVLVELVRGDQHTLQRCDLAGDCVRTVPWQAHPLLGWDYTKTR